MTPASLQPWDLGPGLTVTGTDTGVGKTTLTAAILRLAARMGARFVPWKPVETGCAPTPDDAALLRAAALRTDLPLGLVCPHPLHAPLAPALATPPGAPLDLGALEHEARTARAHGDALIVETAGGLLTPYGPDFLGADLVAALGLPALLVARNALGTINHTLLTLAELRRRHIKVRAIVLVDTHARSTPDSASNAQAIATYSGVEPLFTLPYVSTPRDPDAAAAALAATIEPRRLLSGLRLPCP